MLHKMFHTFDKRHDLDKIREVALNGDKDAKKALDHKLKTQGVWCLICQKHVTQIEGCSGE